MIGFTATESGLLVPPRIGTPRRPDRLTLGPVLHDIAVELGLDPHPWQDHLGDVSLELRARKAGTKGSTWRLAAKQVAAIVPRQSGKSSWSAARIALQCMLPSLAEVAEITGASRIRPQKCAYTAQDRTAAVDRWHEHCELIMGSELATHVAKVVLQRGEQKMIFTNGSVYGIFTPSRTGTRGASLDLVIIDEALAHPAWLLGAVSPTMAARDGMAGTIGAQLVIISNAGGDDAELLNLARELGRRSVANGDDDGRCFMEWSAADGADPYAEATWRATMPTLDQENGITTEYVRMEAETMDISDFRREYLCLHSNRAADHVIDQEAWGMAPDVAITGQIVLAIDATADGSSAALVAAGEANRSTLTDSDETVVAVEVVEQRPGTAWIVDAAVTLAKLWHADVVVDAGGPLAWTLIRFAAAGVNVIPANSREVLAAAALFADSVTAGRLAHQDDPRLAQAVTQATRRLSGDRWGFDRNTGDLSALVAASLAAWAVENGLGLQAAVW